MANITERRNKNGQITSFLIRVSTGRDGCGKQIVHTMSLKKKAEWSEKHARKEAEKAAARFETLVREGRISDSRQRFGAYSEYVISLKEQRGLKHSTKIRYDSLLKRINEKLGYLRLNEISARHLNRFYEYLQTENLNEKTGGKLSPKTVLEYHRLISVILENAVREQIIPFNPAERALPPKVERKEVKCLQIDEIQAVLKALESEPPKWQALINLFVFSGARRGEILGLKWENIDFQNCEIFICNNVLYSADRGVYETSPKTQKSTRHISLPENVMNLLHRYKIEQMRINFEKGIRSDFVFQQDNGAPMHPDSINVWLRRFSERYGLPHLNPHIFRHTMTSLLIHEGVDVVSVAGRLGHSSPSTTTNIYAHVLANADKKSVSILTETILKKA